MSDTPIESTPGGAAAPPSTGHVYDGIEEYDNPLPGWWTNLFYLTIAFSGGYLFINLAQPKWVDSRLAYAAAKEAEIQRQFASLGELQPDPATVLSFATDPEQQKWLVVGESVFRTNCVSCHGKDGVGLSGPNLTDDHYKTVKSLADVPRTITEGSVAAGMPAWGHRLSTNEIVLVAAYVASLRGKNLPGRAPEGEVIPPWTTE